MWHERKHSNVHRFLSEMSDLVIGQLSSHDCLQSFVLPSKCDSGDRIFLIDIDDNSIFEVKEFSIKHCSWLVNDTINRNNSVKFITKYDPTYILLGLLDDTLETSRMQILSDLLTCEKYPGLRLLKMFDEKLVSSVCQWKMCDDEIACKVDLGKFTVFQYLHVSYFTKICGRASIFSHDMFTNFGLEKAMGFLQKRFSQTLKCVANEAKQSMLFADMSQLELHSFDIIADNIGPNLARKLRTTLNIVDKDVGEQAALVAKENIDSSAKKAKIDSSEKGEIEDYTKCGVPITKISMNSVKKAPKTKLKKVSGQQSVSNFFKK